MRQLGLLDFSLYVLLLYVGCRDGTDFYTIFSPFTAIAFILSSRMIVPSFSLQ